MPAEVQKNGTTMRLRVFVGSSTGMCWTWLPNCPAEISITASKVGPSFSTSTATGYQPPARTWPPPASP